MPQRIGQLQERGSSFTGHLATLELDLSVSIEPNSAGRSDSAPTHRVLGEAKSGRLVDVGAAWLRERTRGDAAGERMLSIIIDDPSLRDPLNLIAFPAEGDVWNVTWRRRQTPAG